ncbi:aa0ada74-69c7-45a8-a9ef-77389b905ad4 [Sclerotinia trifoliorum]|uniref:Aa0ada74-69c7-45a8-a9ef-77389b905ad4 n=1 Tax=Sclerotinia trifoliorum TaxID=28548 RepID=A0A8H2VV14_9HELO|nr:aa0ada74-69c7-45a8-a9ef-77389b905ad4 [Sclerotinia trifoliorum]
MNVNIPSTVTLGDLHLPRILYLHGEGVNAEAFRLQCRGLFRALNGTFRLVFPDTPYLSPADPGVLPTYAHLQPFRRPLRWRPEQPNPGPDLRAEKLGKAKAGTDFKFAILLAGRVPLVALDPLLTDSPALADADELTTGVFSQVTGSFLQGSDHLLTLPTLHKDFCRAGTTRLVEWDGDHRVVIRAADAVVVSNEILAMSRQTGAIP